MVWLDLEEDILADFSDVNALDDYETVLYNYGQAASERAKDYAKSRRHLIKLGVWKPRTSNSAAARFLLEHQRRIEKARRAEFRRWVETRHAKVGVQKKRATMLNKSLGLSPGPTKAKRPANDSKRAA